MDKQFLILPAAERETREAFLWYEAQSGGLGDQFLEHLDETFGRIRQNPEMFRVVKKSYRRSLVRRFPYAVWYEVTAESVVVFAVFHCSRNPSDLNYRLP